MNLQDLNLILKDKNFSLTNEMIFKIDSYLKMVIEGNKEINLTAITDYEEMLDKHVYDSLLPSFFIDFKDKNIIDVGTGAGFPGIILAIAFPDSKFTLLDSLGKRITFLNNVVSTLNLNNVNVINSRAEEYSIGRETFDIVISRAVAPLNILLELCTPLAKENSMIVAMKGSNSDQEIFDSKNAVKLLDLTLLNNFKSTLILNHDDRHILVFKKMKKTKNKYPRLYKDIKARPL